MEPRRHSRLNKTVDILKAKTGNPLSMTLHSPSYGRVYSSRRAYKDNTAENMTRAKALGQLVVLGWDVAACTPAPYQRPRLGRPSCGVLILRPASRLDAFSAYPIQTPLPGGAPGGTTGKREVCPARSSRTSARAAQDSCAHDR